MQINKTIEAIKKSVLNISHYLFDPLLLFLFTEDSFLTEGTVLNLETTLSLLDVDAFVLLLCPRHG